MADLPTSSQGDGESPEPPFVIVIALAHAIDPALHMLEVTAHNPVQGDAMHKVIGYHAAKALRQVGWLGPYGIVPGGMDVDAPSHWQPIFVVVDPGAYIGGSSPSSSVDQEGK